MIRRLLALSVLWPAIALADPAPVLVPISQSLLADGDIRYSVPVRVGNSVTVPALLDTGSTGLHIMRGSVFNGSFTDTGFASLYEFGGGDRLSGTVGTGVISIGDASTDNPVPFELVLQASCAAFRPHCSAAMLAPADYGIGGDGIAGQGFQAILGVSLAVYGGAGYTANPLAHIGTRRWIIHLPEPGQGNDGALILNPDPESLQGFQMFSLQALPSAGDGLDGGWVDALPGCLNDATNGEKICGPAILDTGSPGVIADLAGAPAAPLWSQDDQASMSFPADGSDPGFSFVADRNPGTGLLREPAQTNTTRLLDGFLPFFYFDVLYDAANGQIGLRPRADAPSAVTATASSNSVEVIQLNAPAAAPKLPVVITPTQ